MARKEFWLQTTSNEWLKTFYKDLGKRGESEAYWIRYALTEFAKKYENDPKNVKVEGHCG